MSVLAWFCLTMSLHVYVHMFVYVEICFYEGKLKKSYQLREIMNTHDFSVKLSKMKSF